MPCLNSRENSQYSCSELFFSCLRRICLRFVRFEQCSMPINMSRRGLSYKCRSKEKAARRRSISTCHTRGKMWWEKASESWRYNIGNMISCHFHAYNLIGGFIDHISLNAMRASVSFPLLCRTSEMVNFINISLWSKCAPLTH